MLGSLFLVGLMLGQGIASNGFLDMDTIRIQRYKYDTDIFKLKLKQGGNSLDIGILFH